MGKLTNTQIPILTGPDYQHIMCEARILEDGDNVTVTMTMTATGQAANGLVETLTSGEPMALSFVAIPVSPRSTQLKEHH